MRVPPIIGIAALIFVVLAAALLSGPDLAVPEGADRSKDASTSSPTSALTPSAASRTTALSDWVDVALRRDAGVDDDPLVRFVRATGETGVARATSPHTVQVPRGSIAVAMVREGPPSAILCEPDIPLVLEVRTGAKIVVRYPETEGNTGLAPDVAPELVSMLDADQAMMQVVERLVDSLTAPGTSQQELAALFDAVARREPKGGVELLPPTPKLVSKGPGMIAYAVAQREPTRIRWQSQLPIRSVDKDIEFHRDEQAWTSSPVLAEGPSRVVQIVFRGSYVSGTLNWPDWLRSRRGAYQVLKNERASSMVAVARPILRGESSSGPFLIGPLPSGELQIQWMAIDLQGAHREVMLNRRVLLEEGASHDLGVIEASTVTRIQALGAPGGPLDLHIMGAPGTSVWRDEGALNLAFSARGREVVEIWGLTPGYRYRVAPAPRAEFGQRRLDQSAEFDVPTDRVVTLEIQQKPEFEVTARLILDGRPAAGRAARFTWAPREIAATEHQNTPRPAGSREQHRWLAAPGVHDWMALVNIDDEWFGATGSITVADRAVAFDAFLTPAACLVVQRPDGIPKESAIEVSCMPTTGRPAFGRGGWASNTTTAIEIPAPAGIAVRIEAILVEGGVARVGASAVCSLPGSGERSLLRSDQWKLNE